MQIFVNTNFDFMSKRKLALAISGIATLIAVGSLILHGGPRDSVDFTGGTFVEVRFNRPVDPAQLRDAMQSVGLSSSEIQKVGEDNDYGHPAPSALAPFEAGGADVLRTDRDGDLVVVVRDGSLRTATRD